MDIDRRHAASRGGGPYDGRMQPTLREALPSDDAVIDALAREGDATADAGYLKLVRSQSGRLVVAEIEERVVAYGGVVDVDGVAMLTDLFVAADARGQGIGTQLLDALFDGTTQRMTFSSKHPAALTVYRRADMDPQWRLLYLKGEANGGGTGLPESTWAHDRSSLVEEMVVQGARVSADVVSIPDDTGIWIARVCSERPVKALSATLAGLLHGTVVSMCVPEHSPLATWALKSGFATTDYDTFCATSGVRLPRDLHCVDPGLA